MIDYLVDQRQQILTSFGVAAGTAGGGCATLVTIVIYYRRKKMKIDPLDLKLIRNEVSLSAQGASDTNQLYNNTAAANPLFNSSNG